MDEPADQGTVSLDDATFEFISPSTDTLLSDAGWSNKDSSTSVTVTRPEQVQLVCTLYIVCIT